MTEKLRILLADDHETVREGLRMILNAQPDMQVVGTAGDGAEACPAAKVLTLTRHADGSYLQQLMRAGAAGYVLKQSRPAELLHAIRSIATGANYLDTSMTAPAMTSYTRTPPVPPEPTTPLSPRERPKCCA